MSTTQPAEPKWPHHLQFGVNHTTKQRYTQTFLTTTLATQQDKTKSELTNIVSTSITLTYRRKNQNRSWLPKRKKLQHPEEDEEIIVRSRIDIKKKKKEQKKPKKSENVGLCNWN